MRWASTRSNSARFAARLAGRRPRSRALAGRACSHTLPTSLTIAASSAGFPPACSMPSTDSDMRRSVADARPAGRRPRRRARPVRDRARARARSGPRWRQKALRATSLIRELACHLLPGARARRSVISGRNTSSNTTSLKYARRSSRDPADGDARRRHVDQKLASPWRRFASASRYRTARSCSGDAARRWSRSWCR